MRHFNIQNNPSNQLMYQGNSLQRVMLGSPELAIEFSAHEVRVVLRDVARYVLHGQIFMLCSVILCLFLLPDVVFKNLGMSFFGNNFKTLIPYSLGLGGASLFAFKAAHKLRINKQLHFRVSSYCLTVIAFCTLGVLATPYTVNGIFARSHAVTAIMLFVTEVILGVYLSLLVRKDKIQRILLCVQIASSLVAMTAFFSQVTPLLVSEVIAQAAFCVLLLRGVPALGVGTLPDNQTDFLYLNRAVQTNC